LAAAATPLPTLIHSISCFHAGLSQPCPTTTLLYDFDVVYFHDMILK
jgi:hypothetical protein